MADNQSKDWLIRRTFPERHLLGKIGPQGSLKEGPASHQLVGGVIDHQGYDGYPA
jgi:hypothetical protein